jgi:dihydrofolate synthase / folylpolyglutamate synthase
LIDFTERIRIDGLPIPQDSLIDLTHRIRRAAEENLSESPTFFEATTAIAFAYFAHAHVQYAVIEVGMGGQYDATNAVIPLVSVITTIGLDHQQYLGDTCDVIAGEKAGIIKPGIPVVTGRIDGGPRSVIEAVAQRAGATAYALDRDFRTAGDSPARFAYHGVRRVYGDLSCPLRGRHQLDNAACALAALESADASGVTVSEASVRAGFRAVRWPGRLELVQRRPDILLDGAHNPQAADALVRYLAARHAARSSADGQLIFVVGMMRDKDRPGVLARLAATPGISRFILTRAAHPRAAEPADLARDSDGLGIRTEIAMSVREACTRAMSAATPDDIICVTGSLLVIGEAKAFLERTTVSDLRG